MSVIEIFFTCGFISTSAVALLATWLCYLPNFISLYRIVVNHSEQFNPQLDFLPKFKTYNIERRSTQF